MDDTTTGGFTGDHTGLNGTNDQSGFTDDQNDFVGDEWRPAHDDEDWDSETNTQIRGPVGGKDDLPGGQTTFPQDNSGWQNGGE